MRWQRGRSFSPMAPSSVLLSMLRAHTDLSFQLVRDALHWLCRSHCSGQHVYYLGRLVGVQQRPSVPAQHTTAAIQEPIVV